MLGNPEFKFAVFDCDGVILDSNEVKTEAFRFALHNYPANMVDRLIDYHKLNGGVSRYEKFEYFFTKIAKTGSVFNSKDALDRFQSYCKEHLLEARFIPGVLNYIHFLKRLEISMYIVSGSDEKELQDLLRRRSISDYFMRIYGSPTSKMENLCLLLSTLQIRRGGVFFGDAKLDYEIASEKNLQFVYVYGASEWRNGLQFCQSNGLPCIHDFSAYHQ